MSRGMLVALSLALVLSSPSLCRAQATPVFSTDFESGLPAQFTAPGCAIQGVQGWAGLGPAGNQFGGSFLRFVDQPLSDTRLTLSGLPSHTHLDLGFLFAVIDSWDGTELFQVLVDGTLVFSHSFQLALGDTCDYVPAPGALLSSGTNLGFSNGSYYQHDRAYNLAVEPSFIGIPHTASSVDIVWRIGAVSGPAAAQWQGGDDESWAIDNVAVSVSNNLVGVHESPSREFDVRLGANPSSGEARVVFALPAAADARVALFDVGGRLIRTLAEGRQEAGDHVLTWDGRTAAGTMAPSGLYIVAGESEGRHVTRRLVRITR